MGGSECISISVPLFEQSLHSESVNGVLIEISVYLVCLASESWFE